MSAVSWGQTLAIVAVVAPYVAGCGAPSDGPRPEAAKVAQAPNANGPAPDGPPASDQRKIIYTSQIEVLVADMASTQERLEVLIKSVREAGGYLARLDISGRSGNYRHSTWTVRVPLAKFDQFVAEVEGLGTLWRHSREAQDVTDAYADLDARLRNKQTSEVRLLSHLQKTGELKDTLEVERELSRVRGEIEQLQGQLNLLKNKTDLATVTVTLFERETYAPLSDPDFSSQIYRTFDSSRRGLVLCGKVAVLAIVALTPWLLIACVFIVPGLLILRRRRISRV